MHSIPELQSVVRKTFDTMQFPLVPANLYNPIKYTFDIGGKRIRPLLVLMGCDLIHGVVEDALPAAVAIELFHNFTLLHDDIMDNAPLRRGKETVFKKWNSDIAILSGDTMFALACEHLARCKASALPKVLAEFTKTARMVCEGQQYDMDYEQEVNVAISDYLEMIRLKTAVLIGSSLKIGAILGGASSSAGETLYSFGENIGMAFQLQDDLLDTFGHEDKFGKEIGGDIATGKKTFLYLKAFEIGGERDRSELKTCFSDSLMPVAEKILRVRNVYDSLGIAAITSKVIEDYFKEAVRGLEKMPVDAEGKEMLTGFTGELLKRDY